MMSMFPLRSCLSNCSLLKHHVHLSATEQIAYALDPQSTGLETALEIV